MDELTKEVKERVLEIARMIYHSKGCDGFSMSLEDFYKSTHPHEKGCAVVALEAYNISTASEWEMEDLLED